MIVFLYGPDDYRRLKKKNEIIGAFEKKHSRAGVEFFDGTDSKESDILDLLYGFSEGNPLFTTSKLAVTSNLFELEKSKLAKALVRLIKDKNTTVLISEREKPVKDLGFLLKSPVISEKFELLKGAEWLAFIKKESKMIGLELSNDAAAFLAQVYRGDSWALRTELEKLASLKKSVDKSDLDGLDLEIAPDYWSLINGLKSYDVRNRIFALEKLFATGDQPPKIFNIMAAQSGEKVSWMAEYDFAVKSGKLDYEEALLDSILG